MGSRARMADRRVRQARRGGGVAVGLVLVALAVVAVGFRDRIFPNAKPSTTPAAAPEPVTVAQAPPAASEPPGGAPPRKPAGAPPAPPTEAAPEPEAAPTPPTTPPEPGVRDGVTGANLGLDPFDRMENPQGVTIPKDVTGTRLANAATFHARWLQAWGDSLRERNGWQLLREAAGGIAVIEEQASAARDAYLLHAVAAERWRSDFYGAIGARASRQR